GFYSDFPSRDEAPGARSTDACTEDGAEPLGPAGVSVAPECGVRRLRRRPVRGSAGPWFVELARGGSAPARRAGRRGQHCNEAEVGRRRGVGLTPLGRRVVSKSNAVQSVINGADQQIFTNPAVVSISGTGDIGARRGAPASPTLQDGDGRRRAGSIGKGIFVDQEIRHAYVTGKFFASGSNDHLVPIPKNGAVLDAVEVPAAKPKVAGGAGSDCREAPPNANMGSVSSLVLTICLTAIVGFLLAQLPLPDVDMAPGHIGLADADPDPHALMTNSCLQFSLPSDENRRSRRRRGPLRLSLTVCIAVAIVVMPLIGIVEAVIIATAIFAPMKQVIVHVSKGESKFTFEVSSAKTQSFLKKDRAKKRILQRLRRSKAIDHEGDFITNRKQGKDVSPPAALTPDAANTVLLFHFKVAAVARK
ncbi:hypothetical protein BDK51DRAFT_48570, partial [Blyttiomyces helicus]